MTAKFWIFEFAQLCLMCPACETWVASRGRRGAPCERAKKLAAELAAEQSAAGDVTAQPCDRELDPDDDVLALPVLSPDEADPGQVAMNFMFRRKAAEELAAADRPAGRRRPQRSAARQPRRCSAG